MRLLERESHLSSLTQYAEEAHQGQGRLVLLAGEAGVGKSSLLDHLEEQLPDARWAWGACDGLFTPRPLAPLLDIGSQLGGTLGNLVRDGAPREQLFAALLEQLASSEDLNVLVVEDVHWADKATLDLLRFVGRRIRATRVLVLVTYRDEGLAADDALRVVVGQLSGQRSTRRILLPGLSASGVAVLAEGSEIDTLHLHELTGGNPFFVSEVLQTSGPHLPRSVRDAVLARTADLGDDARGVLEVAALIGSKVEPGLLIAATDSRGHVIDQLVDTGVLVADGDVLRFRHEIARMAVQAAIPPQRTAAAHRRILDALRAADDTDNARLAHHAEGAGDDELVLVYAPRAGRQASQLAAHREAVVQYARAVKASSRADVETVAALYDAYAHELSLVDRWQDSADASHEALSRWRAAGDRLHEGDSLRRLSRTMWRLCHGEEAEAAAVGALDALEPLGETAELAWGYANLANHRMNRGENEQAIEAARRARELAEPFSLKDALSDALNTEACASAALGLVWSPLLHRSLEIAKEERLDEQAGRAYANLYSLYVEDLKIPEGESIYVDGLAYCEDHDIATFLTCLQGERTHVLERLGRWDQAAALAAGLLEQHGPSPVNRLNPLLSLGTVQARRGDVEGAWKCLDEAESLVESLDEPEFVAAVTRARAEAHWLEGRTDAALHELDRAQPHIDRTGTRGRSQLACWRRRITGTSPAAPYAVEPWASELTGDLALATAKWDKLGLPYEAAVSLLTSEKETDLRHALSRLDALGATATLEVARQVMRRHGFRAIAAGARASTKAHPAGLTRREQEVLELVSEGLTNDEISARLFLSTKTVDHHVSSILAKLGVPSRKLAAAEAARLGLVGVAT